MTEFPLSPLPSAAEVDRNTQRRRLRSLLIAAAVVWGLIGLSQTPSDVLIAGASPQSADPEFHAWYSASPRNAAYYHLRDEFGTGAVGDRAVQIAICESDLNPRAVSPTNDHGVMQLNAPSWRDRFEQVTGQAWNPNVYHASYNAAFAKWLHDETGGFSHWACAR